MEAPILETTTSQAQGKKDFAAGDRLQVGSHAQVEESPSHSGEARETPEGATNFSTALYKKLVFTIKAKGEPKRDIDLLKYLIPGPAKVSYVLYELFPGSKVGDKNYFTLYRRFKYLEKAGLVKLEKGRSGYVPYEKEGLYASPRAKLLDLIKQVQCSNHLYKSAKQKIDPLYRIPQRCRPERVEAIKIAMKVRGRRLFQRQYYKPTLGPLNEDLTKYLGKVDDRFTEYSDIIREKRILLRHKTDPDQVLTLPFRTRFNDMGRKTKNMKEFEAGWDKTLTMARRAVFLTLTTDPGDNDSLWRRNRHMGKAFNRYQSLLTKRHQIQYRYFIETPFRKEFLKDNHLSRIETREQYLKYQRFLRPHKKEISAQLKGISFRRKYICVNEFQENGLIHSHIVIFGIRWLAEKDVISLDWQRCEQGKIVDIYAMANDGKQWLWSREKPKDSEGRSPEEYLKKYLKKGLFSEDGFSMYWTINKRFFTMSKVFASAPRRTVQVSLWSYIGAWEEYNIPDWVWKQNRGAPAYSNWDGWERIRSIGPGELALC